MAQETHAAKISISLGTVLKRKCTQAIAYETDATIKNLLKLSLVPRERGKPDQLVTRLDSRL